MARFFFVFAIVLCLVALGAYVFQHMISSSVSAVGTTTPASTTDAYMNATSDDIFVSVPKPAANVSDAISISGFARGPWYFEAVFPVEVESATGALIGHGQAQAQAEWTTDQFVPFIANISLDTQYSGAATIILKKDNPSGDSAKDASLSIPIVIQ